MGIGFSPMYKIGLALIFIICLLVIIVKINAKLVATINEK